MRQPTAAISIAAALVLTAVTTAGAQHLSDMPGLPWWLGAGAALAAAGLVSRPDGSRESLRRRYRWEAVAGGVMVLAAVLRLPHDLLGSILGAIQPLTGVTGPFDVDPPFAMTAAELLLLGAAIAVLRRAVRDRRIAKGVCAACGRPNAAPPAPRLARLRVLATIAALAPLPYAALKLAWGLGSDIGLLDPSAFAGVTFLSPGYGDTVVLSGVGVAAALAMGVPARSRLVRLGLLTIGVLGAAMLLPVAVIGSPDLIAIALGWSEITDAVIASWAFAMVYGCFTLWGTSLAALTGSYYVATRGSCTRHTDIAQPDDVVSGSVLKDQSLKEKS